MAAALVVVSGGELLDAGGRSVPPDGVGGVASGPVLDSPEPVVVSPGPVVDSSGPVLDSPGPVVDSSGPVLDSPGPVLDSPGPVVTPPESGGVLWPSLSSDCTNSVTGAPHSSGLPSTGLEAVTWASSGGREVPSYVMARPAAASAWLASANVFPVTVGTVCSVRVSKDWSSSPSLPSGRAIPRSGFSTSTSWSWSMSGFPGGGSTSTM